jgi:hypothetical protein
MKKIAILAAVAAVSAVAVPASAAQLIRISLVDKSTAQIDALTVCTDRKADVSDECVTGAIGAANRQLAAITKARATKTAAPRQDLTVVRVSLKGKSADQIDADIKLAAQTVCKATNGVGSMADYRACVGYAVRSAKAQLQAAAVASRQDA